MQLFKTKSTKDKEDVKKLITELKTSIDNKIEFSDCLFQQTKKNAWKKFYFFLTSEPNLYIIEETKTSYELVKLDQENMEFEQIFLEVSQIPYHINLGKNMILGFESHVTFHNFVKCLKKFNLSEIKPEFHKFTTHLDKLPVKDWKIHDSIRWLGTMYFKNEPLSLKYENMIKGMNGLELIKLTKEDFLKHYNSNDSAIILHNEIQKLKENSIFSTNKMRFRMKIDALNHKKDEEVAKYMDEHEYFLFSLCDEDELLKTYLNVHINEKIHENSEKFVKSPEGVEIRLILSEFTHNNQMLSIPESFSGTINSMPKFDWSEKFGHFKCALLIGPYYLEFTDSSICVPKRLNSDFGEIFRQIKPIRTLKKFNLSYVTKKISNIIVKWNTRFLYKAANPDLKSKESNGFHFINELLHQFDDEFDFEFLGSLVSLMDEIQVFGDCGASILPGKHQEILREKFNFSSIQECKSHAELDNELLNILEEDKMFKIEFLQDYICFQLIDLAFWFRSMIHQKEEYVQCYDGNEPCCPCFSRGFFLNIFQNYLLNVPEEKMPTSEMFMRIKKEREVIVSESPKKETKFHYLMKNVAQKFQASPKSPQTEKSEDDFYYSSDEEKSKKLSLSYSVSRKRALKKSPSKDAMLHQMKGRKQRSRRKSSHISVSMIFTENGKPSTPTSRRTPSKQYIVSINSSNENSPMKNHHNQSFIKLYPIIKTKPEIKKLEIFDDPIEVEIFKQFSIEHSAYEEFLYYEIYQKWHFEESEIERNILLHHLFDRFIHEKGSDSITFTFRKLKNLKRIFSDEPKKAIEIVYNQIFDRLNALHSQYVESEYWRSEELKTDCPDTFNEIIDNQEAFKLFSNFVSNTVFGSQYIDCWNDLKDYEKNNSKRKILKILGYVKENSSHNFLHNPEIRKRIVINDKLQPGGFEAFLDYVHDILAYEYYPRFKYTKIWKNYHNAKAPKNLDLKFKDMYTVIQIDKEISSFDCKIQHMIVQHKVTAEMFKAKKIISLDKKFIKKKSIEYLDNVPHRNLINVIDSFTESDTNEYNLILITTLVVDSLAKDVHHKIDVVKESLILRFMIQILRVMNLFHQNGKFGRLNEASVYLSSSYITVYIDPGFYIEDDIQNPDYLRAPEIHQQSPRPNEKSDIYCAGFVLIKFLTQRNSKEMQQIFDLKISSPKSSSLLSAIPRKISLTPKYEKPHPYFNNFQKEIGKFKDSLSIDPKILDLMMHMIQPDPKNRPTVSELLNSVHGIKEKKKNSKLQKPIKKTRFDGLTKNQKQLIQNDTYRQYFKEYLRTEMSVESILFFEDVQLFNEFRTCQERIIKANEIIQAYLTDESELEVNVSGKLRRTLEIQVEDAEESGELGTDIWDDIAIHIIETTLLNSYQRFENSPMAKSLMKKIKSKSKK
eukprot:gene3325-5764_t